LAVSASAEGDERPARPDRGRAAVERRLVEAAAELLGEVGPEQLSMRTLSQRAKANSGLIYHYFGSKEALLQAAMRHLYEHHYEHMQDRNAMGLLEDTRYWRALGHAVLDGAEDLFRQEIDAGMSMPLDYLEAKRDEAGGTLDADQTAYVLANVALTLGWATYEPFLMALVGEGPGKPTLPELRRAIERLLVQRMSARP
jgi:AcrR family transcriptional regulator